MSLEMRLWQKYGAVSCALIKHSSFIVAPSSLLFSQKLKEQVTTKLQQSCQLDKNSQYISVTRQQGTSFSQARSWGAVETFSFQSLCPRRTLGPESFLEQLWFIFLCVYSKTGGLNLCSTCKRTKSNFTYAAGCRISSNPQSASLLFLYFLSPSLSPSLLFSFPPILPSFLPFLPSFFPFS